MSPGAEGIWVWPVPPGTTIETRDDIAIDGLRSANWLGHRPVSDVNAIRFSSYCLPSLAWNMTTVPLRALGVFDSLSGLRAAAAREGLVTADLKRRFEEVGAGGANVATVAWRDWTGDSGERLVVFSSFH